jgi:hypothetical protein
LLKLTYKYEFDMGKIIGNSIVGGVGNMVFWSHNGNNYVRMAPRKRSKNSWSGKQVENRERFKALAEFWMQFSGTQVEEIWKVAEEGKRGYNLFLKANSPAFGPDGTLLDRERLHFSAGQLLLPHLLTASRVPDDPEKVEVSWQYDEGSGSAMPDDELMMMVSNADKFTGPIKTGALRKQESAVIQLPTVTGTIQGIYLFFGSDKRKLYSPDMYFGI